MRAAQQRLVEIADKTGDGRRDQTDDDAGQLLTAVGVR